MRYRSTIGSMGGRYLLPLSAENRAAARERFDALAYSHRQRHVLAIDGAKAPGTRQRRIAKAIEMLRSQ